MKYWQRHEVNKSYLRESDKRIISMLNEAYKANGSKLKDVATRLNVSQVMVRAVLNGGNNAISYYRYLPKTLAFLKACNCRMRIEAYPIKDE